MPTLVPILRIFDYAKALEFYVDWLGFAVDWADQPTNAPAYVQVSLAGVALNLSEHHGDCSPGARIRVIDFAGLAEYHQQLLAKDYRYNRPGLHVPAWNARALEMEVIDPFGNRLTFTEVPV
ncbi:glyoxalase superfamily protein [Hymenobacter sp. DG25A]|uniref:glyoxalase superfamily protein n=1 Tax=Hymenobacter sp. DG25A TaxID=1385663 RepID=UPI0006BDB14F|nr:glyoxalase/bleomycin resistance/extradiol dioxygenase family protein [Hymenobacter sp. DG25A]ALD22574.1 bleomycin resistance protein [Hymenobacter sp. DG25A]